NTMDINQDGTDDGTVYDIIQFSFEAEDFSKVDKVVCGFLLGDETNYYYQQWTSVDFIGTNNPIVLAERRGGFKRAGANLDLDWHNVSGVIFSVFASSTQVFRFGKAAFWGGNNTAALIGEYQYTQIFVSKTDAYVGKSKTSPISSVISTDHNSVYILPQDPTIIEPQANEIWLFRRGGNLDQFYRVAVIKLEDF